MWPTRSPNSSASEMFALPSSSVSPQHDVTRGSAICATPRHCVRIAGMSMSSSVLETVWTDVVVATMAALVIVSFTSYCWSGLL